VISFNSEKKPLIFSCGSGITACIVLLALETVIDNPKALYDGSWSEWGLLD
jgi:thiosulfate/3-mercaptopyruvate sulfurtransferase